MPYPFLCGQEQTSHIYTCACKANKKIFSSNVSKKIKIIIIIITFPRKIRSPTNRRLHNALSLEEKCGSLCIPLCIDVYAGPLLRALSLRFLSRRFIVRGPLSLMSLKNIPRYAEGVERDNPRRSRTKLSIESRLHSRATLCHLTY